MGALWQLGLIVGHGLGKRRVASSALVRWVGNGGLALSSDALKHWRGGRSRRRSRRRLEDAVIRTRAFAAPSHLRPEGRWDGKRLRSAHLRESVLWDRPLAASKCLWEGLGVSKQIERRVKGRHIERRHVLLHLRRRNGCQLTNTSLVGDRNGVHFESSCRIGVVS